MDPAILTFYLIIYPPIHLPNHPSIYSPIHFE